MGHLLEVLWPRGKLEPVRGAVRAGSAQEGQSPTADHDAFLDGHRIYGSGLRLLWKEGARALATLLYHHGSCNLGKLLSLLVSQELHL